MAKKTINYDLTPESVDQLSADLVSYLEENMVDRHDIIRLRLSVEDILVRWMDGIEAGTPVIFTYEKKWGRNSFEIKVEGPRLDPNDHIEEAEDPDPLLFNALLAQSSLSIRYDYKNGANCISFQLSKKERMSQLTQIAIAIVAAILLGWLSKYLPSTVNSVIQGAAQPLFDTILNALRALASPLIFLSVCWGIISIGDLGVVQRIGKRVISRMVIYTFVVAIVFLPILLLIFPVPIVNGGGASDFSDIYKMILAIVPSDFTSPFIKGSALEIIFMGLCLGLALLLLGDRVAIVRSFIGQANLIAQSLMSIIGKIMPLFIFLSVFTLFLSGVFSNLSGIIKALAASCLGSFLLSIVYVIYLSLRCRVSFRLLIKKLLPTWLIAVSTASSAAAFTTNLETCERRLGIPSKMVSFAIPLGQVIYMPAGVIIFLANALFIAQVYSVEITPVWLITAVISTGLLAMATTPVPGGALTIYTILFAQLGLPTEAVATAIAVDMLGDFVVTASNLTCLQVEGTLAARKLGLLNEGLLKKGVPNLADRAKAS